MSGCQYQQIAVYNTALRQRPGRIERWYTHAAEIHCLSGEFGAQIVIIDAEEIDCGGSYFAEGNVRRQGHIDFAATGANGNSAHLAGHGPGRYS
mgnify:CR=1 FL=1